MIKWKEIHLTETSISKYDSFKVRIFLMNVGLPMSSEEQQGKNETVLPKRKEELIAETPISKTQSFKVRIFWMNVGFLMLSEEQQILVLNSNLDCFA